ncbi:C45 family autoproteolytic acyltransferase/hydolase [Shewanella fidelis]|uniref:C45 family autoproteolytic acyltransferase/hydolase n=1 Tax=Shewanella fidelis TaxID=173509 RepID=UPI00048CFAC7|nr:C45 family autoproteolytic acyltransferase/hydolase [Shewanella fidelis]
MKKSIIAATLALSSIFSVGAQAELIQHTDQIAEVKFQGSSYELGLHVGVVAKAQILDGIERFDNTLGVMLPGLNVISLSKSFEAQSIFTKLKASSPDAAAYIQGLSESLNRSPNLLLAVGMSDEAILESQRSGGMGFLQAEKPAHDPAAPAKCTVLGMSDKQGRAWGQANFDYMGINYEGLIVLNHTDVDGQTRVIQTWAGLIPYGGIAKGGQAIMMNTMADEGTAREKAGAEILVDNATPSYYLSWEAYNIGSQQELLDIFNAHQQYTAFFSYTVIDSNAKVMNIENNFSAAKGGVVNHSYADKMVHANHSLYQQQPFVDQAFAAKSLPRQAAAESFLDKASIETTKAQTQEFAETSVLWKGRGEMMGTVTSTRFDINGDHVDMFIKTDMAHPEVHIKNY